VLPGIERRLIKPRLPQTSGMVIPKRGQKCFNDRIGDVFATTRFRSREDLQTTLECYLTLYNQHLPQKPLCHKALFQALRQWHADRPVTFSSIASRHVPNGGRLPADPDRTVRRTRTVVVGTAPVNSLSSVAFVTSRWIRLSVG
jgi:hypothetical protein